MLLCEYGIDQGVPRSRSVLCSLIFVRIQSQKLPAVTVETLLACEGQIAQALCKVVAGNVRNVLSQRGKRQYHFGVVRRDVADLFFVVSVFPDIFLDRCDVIVLAGDLYSCSREAEHYPLVALGKAVLFTVCVQSVAGLVKDIPNVILFGNDIAALIFGHGHGLPEHRRNDKGRIAERRNDIVSGLGKLHGIGTVFVVGNCVRIFRQSLEAAVVCFYTCVRDRHERRRSGAPVFLLQGEGQSTVVVRSSGELSVAIRILIGVLVDEGHQVVALGDRIGDAPE